MTHTSTPEIFLFEDTPFELKSGMTAAEVKARQVEGKKNFRCRHGLHFHRMFAAPHIDEQDIYQAALTTILCQDVWGLTQCKHCGEILVRMYS